MKFLYHIILYVLLSQWLWSNYCPQFHCVKKINKKTHIPYLTCTLHAMPGLAIACRRGLMICCGAMHHKAPDFGWVPPFSFATFLEKVVPKASHRQGCGAATQSATPIASWDQATLSH